MLQVSVGAFTREAAERFPASAQVTQPLVLLPGRVLFPTDPIHGCAVPARPALGGRRLGSSVGRIGPQEILWHWARPLVCSMSASEKNTHAETFF